MKVSELRLRPVPNVVPLPCRTQMNLVRQWHDDSTVAVSNVELNTVAPNSKDKTNHPSSGNISKYCKIHSITL